MDSNQSAKDEVKRTVDIVELIGQFVQLKRAGLNYIGLCPFHSEKDPSFTVNAAKQMFHCFGCKKGGDVFAFWMEYHKVPFPQALEDLAERYHISLPKRKLTPAEKGKLDLQASLIELNEIATEYFHGILTKSEEGRPGKDYLEKRGISKEIMTEFRLGYAPAKWDGLTLFLKQKKGDMDKAVQAGLIIPNKKGGHYDRFRGRVIFPIMNLRQQVVGFGGRVLDHSLPKYLNTPETPVFHKGTLLYGLNSSVRPIRESRRAVIVEGYTDVLALKMHGFHEAVATLGTALTGDHVRLLKGYAGEAVVVFDPDTAGKTAAMKSLAFFLSEGLASKVMVLPENDDPDTFVNKNGLDAFLDLLNGSMPMFDFFLDMKLSQGSDHIEDQVNVLKEILPALSEIKNHAQRSFYVRRLSEKLGIAESAVLTELKKWTGNHSSDKNEVSLRQRLSASKATITDDLPLLNLLIHYPHTVEKLTNHDFRDLISDPIMMEIFDSMLEIHGREGAVTPEAILERLENISAKERLREAMLMHPIFRDDEVEQAIKEFEDRAHRIKISKSSRTARELGEF